MPPYQYVDVFLRNMPAIMWNRDWTSHGGNLLGRRFPVQRAQSPSFQQVDAEEDQATEKIEGGFLPRILVTPPERRRYLDPHCEYSRLLKKRMHEHISVRTSSKP